MEEKLAYIEKLLQLAEKYTANSIEVDGIYITKSIFYKEEEKQLLSEVDEESLLFNT